MGGCTPLHSDTQNVQKPPPQRVLFTAYMCGRGPLPCSALRPSEAGRRHRRATARRRRSAASRASALPWKNASSWQPRSTLGGGGRGRLAWHGREGVREGEAADAGGELTELTVVIG